MAKKKFYIEYIEQVGQNPAIKKAKIEKSEETLEELLLHSHVTFAEEIAMNLCVDGEVLSNGDVVDEDGEVVGNYKVEEKKPKKEVIDKQKKKNIFGKE